MRPKVADKANPSAETSATSGAEVGGGSISGTGSSGLSHLPFLFCVLTSTLLGRLGTLSDESAPGWTVGSLSFPQVCIDSEILEGNFQAVLEALLLPAD